MTPAHQAAADRGDALILAAVGITWPRERQLAQDLLLTRGAIPHTRDERAAITAAYLAHISACQAWVICWNSRGLNSRLPAIERRKAHTWAVLQSVCKQARATRAARAIQQARQQIDAEAAQAQQRHDDLNTHHARRLLSELQPGEVIRVVNGKTTIQSPREYVADLCARAATVMADRP